MEKGVIPIFIGIGAGGIYKDFLNLEDVLCALKAPVCFRAPETCLEEFAM